MDNYYKRKRNIRDIAINITNLCKQQVIGQQKIQGLLGDVVSMLDESLESSNLFSIANKDTEDAIFQPKNIIICLVMRKTANSLEKKLKKFAFYLIRSLNIEQKQLDSRNTTMRGYFYEKSSQKLPMFKLKRKQNEKLNNLKDILNAHITVNVKLSKRKYFLQWLQNLKNLNCEQIKKIIAFTDILNKLFSNFFQDFQIKIKNLYEKSCIFKRISDNIANKIKKKSINYIHKVISKKVLSISSVDYYQFVKPCNIFPVYIEDNSIKNYGIIKIFNALVRVSLKLKAFGLILIEKHSFKCLKCKLLEKILNKIQRSRNFANKFYGFQAILHYGYLIIKKRKYIKCMIMMLRTIKTTMNRRLFFSFQAIKAKRSKKNCISIKNLQIFEKKIVFFFKKYYKIKKFEIFSLIKSINSQFVYLDHIQELSETIKKVVNNHLYKEKFQFFRHLKIVSLRSKKKAFALRNLAIISIKVHNKKLYSSFM